MPTPKQPAIIHINQLVIRSNLKHNERNPPIAVRGKTRSVGVEYCHEADLVLDDGTVVGTLVYSPDKPLDCGARLWLQCYVNVIPRVWEKKEEQDNDAQ